MCCRFPEPLPGQMRENLPSVFWVCPSISLPVGCARKISNGRCPGRILIRCLNHFNFLTWGSSSSISLLWMLELLTLSPRLSPATQRKLISGACVCDLILLVTTQSHRWGSERRSTGKSKAFLPAQLSSALLLMQHLSGCQSPALSDPHSCIRPWDTSAPSCGAETLSQLGESNPPFSCRKPWLQTWRFWLSSQPLPTHLQTSPGHAEGHCLMKPAEVQQSQGAQ